MEKAFKYLKDFANSNNYYDGIHIGIIVITEDKILSYDGINKHCEYHEQIINSIPKKEAKESIILHLTTFDFERVVSITIDIPNYINEYQYNTLKKINEELINIKNKTNKKYFMLLKDEQVNNQEQFNLDILLNEIEYKVKNPVYKKS